jgi:hypothetical protein
MSIQLRVLRDPEFTDIELMAPDLDADYIWLWDADGADHRIDLSRKQMRELRDALNELLPPFPKTES